MADTSKVLGLGQQFTFEDKTYKIAAPEYKYLGEFELWLENKALQKIERQHGKIPEDVYRARHDAMIAKVGSGAYERGQPEFQKAMESHEGLQQFMWVLMEPVNPGITRDVVDRLWAAAYEEMMARVSLTIHQIKKPAGALPPESG
jgi:hypothetical protein